MKRAIFADGTYLEARTWAGVLRKLRKASWMHPDDTPTEFRRAMAQRAEVWGGVRVHPLATSKRFVQGLERAGLLQVIDDDEEA